MDRETKRGIYVRAMRHKLARAYLARIAAGMVPSPSIVRFSEKEVAKGPPQIPLGRRGGGRRARWRRRVSG